jgi:SAM-dependent methyltransferase
MNKIRGRIGQENEKTWEKRWAPHDEATYQAVLAAIQPDDVVLEIGAGDLRLARRLAALAREVYAIELQLPLLAPFQADTQGEIPPNLYVIWGDARTLPFPEGISTGVLLMRHCTHFRLYWDKLQAVGAKRLFTNARWRMGVESIDLEQTRAPFKSVDFGWYGCRCGSIGFIPGKPERLTSGTLNLVHEVAGCPRCLLDVDIPAWTGK